MCLLRAWDGSEVKINRRNPRHWLLLVLFGVNSVLAWCLRRAWPQQRRKLAVLYGHRLCGNLEAIRRYALQVGSDWQIVFLTMDAAYAAQLRAAGVAVCHAAAPACVSLLWRAHAVISDHGLHAMWFLPGRSDLRFYDVWHGIPFKGFDADDFRVQHRYEETWVASPLLRNIYVERFGFRSDMVAATGYARTDRLLRGSVDVSAVRNRLGIPVSGPLVMFAPTWAQDRRGRSPFPFGIAPGDFLRAVGSVLEKHNGWLLVRTHLNSGDGRLPTVPGTAVAPFASYPDTEALLAASDVLVCDWSSIAFDFLVLDRPALFLNVEPPFRKGFSLGPEYRFGPIAGSMEELLSQLDRSLDGSDPYAPRRAEIHTRVYGGLADGRSSARCLARLQSGWERTSTRD